MKVNITKEARDFIMQKGGVVYVNEANSQGCFSGATPILSIYVGKPKDTTRFELVEDEGASVYVDRRYVIRNVINISLDNILMIKKLYVEAKSVEE